MISWVCCSNSSNLRGRLSNAEVRRKPYRTKLSLLDYFPKDSLFIIDESHVTLPQLQGMYKGDRSRKESLALAQPNALLIIEYPRTFVLHNLRKFERLKTNVPVTFFSEEGDRKFKDFGIIRDISSGGALISHAKKVAKKKTYTYICRASYGR